jgi:hypothetical protein
MILMRERYHFKIVGLAQSMFPISSDFRSFDEAAAQSESAVLFVNVMGFLSQIRSRRARK